MRPDWMEGFAFYLRDVRRYALETTTAYVNDVERFFLFSPSGFSLEKLDRWVSSMSGLSVATVNRRISSVRAYFRYLGMTSLSQSFPDVDTPRRLPPLGSVFSVEQISDLFKRLSLLPKADQALFLLGYTCGMRIGEIVALRWSAVDFSRGVVAITGKGNRDRVVPLSIELQSVLRQMKNDAGDVPYVFSNRRGGHLSVRTGQGRFRRICQALNFDERAYSTHTMRRTAATHMLSSGATIKDVQSFLGHKRLATTQRYTLVSATNLVETFVGCHPRL